jgi:S-adenosylmethionine decarboxylase
MTGATDYAERSRHYAAEIARTPEPLLLDEVLRPGLRVAEVPSGTSHFLPAYAAASTEVTLIHAVYDVTGCDRTDVSAEQIMTAMRQTAEALGCTIRAQLIEPFQPHGATCVLILAESHITVSTWPEHQLAHIDVFTCRAIMEPGKAIQPVLDVLGGHVAHTRNVPRLSPAALDNTNLDSGLA